MTTRNHPSLDWPEAEPLGADARRRREEMLAGLRGELRAHRRRRLGTRAALAAIVLLAGAGTLRALTRGAPAGPLATLDPAGTPAIPDIAPPTPTTPNPPTTPTTPTAPPGPTVRPLIAVFGTDPTVVGRLAAARSSVTITTVGDEELLPLLERLGAPGLIKLDGRLVLTRDLPRAAEAPGPQSLGPEPGASRG